MHYNSLPKRILLHRHVRWSQGKNEVGTRLNLKGSIGITALSLSRRPVIHCITLSICQIFYVKPKVGTKAERPMVNTKSFTVLREVERHRKSVITVSAIVVAWKFPFLEIYSDGLVTVSEDSGNPDDLVSPIPLIISYIVFFNALIGGS